MGRLTGIGLLSLLLLGQGASVLAAADSPKQDEGHWYLQSSVYTMHFSKDPEHNDRQKLIGLERNEASGLIYGGATFLNSFDQRSVYGYVGKRFDSSSYPAYLKVSGGFLYGYRGEYRDKIPLNRYGLAPVIIPSVGAHFGPVGAEVALLGFNAAMLNVGLRF